MGFHKEANSVWSKDAKQLTNTKAPRMDATQPRGIKAWLNHAKSVPLPILKVSVRTLNKQIKAGASLADMANTIERDPALCLHLFLAANKASHEANPDLDADILGINHVLTILGMHGVVHVIKGLPTLKINGRSAYQKAYLQAQSNSMFAAKLAGHWAEKGNFGDGDKIKWSTLLCGAPNWVMWQCAYGEMRQLEWYRYKQRFSRRKSEAKLFGCYLEDIERMLGRHFKLPSISQQALESAELPSLKQWAKILSHRHLDYFDEDVKLKQIKRKPSVVIALARSLAKESTLGWLRRHSQRSERALSNLLHQPLDRTSEDIHQQAVAFSRKFPAPYVVLPAQSLLWPDTEEPWLRQPFACVSECLSDEQLRKTMPNMAGVAQPEKKPIPKGQRLDIPDLPPQPPREVNKDLLQELINRFKSQAAGFKDVHEILLTCNKAINEGLGMRHTVIFVADKTGKGLRPVYCVGIEPESPLRALKVALVDNSFFGKLMVKTGALKIDPGNYHQVKSMMTSEVLTTLGNKNFMAMSLFANNKAVGVVYADAAVNEDEISDKEYQAFKQICQATSSALDYYAKKRKK